MGKERLRLSFGLALIAVLTALLHAGDRDPRRPPDRREHVDLGLSYELQGRMDLAEREYLKAAGKERDWSVPYFNLGNVAYSNGDLAAAEKHYSRALERDPKNPDIMNNLATGLHEQGMDARARALIEQALGIRHRQEYLDTLRRIDSGVEHEGADP
jgi:Flp pilus assembly protein TadD